MRSARIPARFRYVSKTIRTEVPVGEDRYRIPQAG